MKLKLRDLLQMSTFQHATILSGKDHLENLVSFTYVIDTFPNLDETINWIVDDVLLFVFGHSMADHPEKLLRFIPVIERYRIPGIVVYTGKYLHEIPEEVVRQFEYKHIPLITLPWEVKYLEVNNQIFSKIAYDNLITNTQHDILYSILFENDYDVLVNQLNAMNFHFDKSHCILIGDIVSFKHYLKIHALDELSAQRIKDTFHEITMSTLSSLDIHALSLLRSDKVIVLLEQEDLQVLISHDFRHMMQQAMAHHYPDIHMTFGAGNSSLALEEFKESYFQAMHMITALRNGLCEPTCWQFNELGIYQLFFHEGAKNQLASLYPQLIKPIIEYDKTHQSDFLMTLNAYLRNHLSLTKAAKELYVHKNTVLYRIDKISSMIDCDLSDPDVAFNILFEIRIMKYLSIS